MKAALSTTSYALLGLLRLRSWTTYELAKQAQRSLHWFWPRAERKLYDEPKRLVAEGLATATREATGQRARTVYTVTDSGRDALREWLDAPLAPRTSEFEGMVKLFFADAGSKDQLLLTLERIGAEAAERVATLKEFAAADMPFPRRLPLRALGLSLQHEQEVAIVRWSAWARDQVAHWVSSEDAGDWDTAAVLDHLVSGTFSAGGDLGLLAPTDPGLDEPVEVAVEDRVG